MGGTAVAQPAPEVEPAVWDGKGYPRDLAQRPLTLPEGAFEVVVPLAWTRSAADPDDDSFNVVYVRPRARYTVAQIEIEAGVDVYVWQTELELSPGIPYPEPSRVPSIYLAGRFAMSPDQFIGAEITSTGLFGDENTAKRYIPAVVFGHKVRLSPRAGLELTAGAGYDHTRFDSGTSSFSSSAIFGLGQFRAQAQVSPEVALEARATLRAFKDTSDDMMFMINPSGVGADFGLRLVASVAPDFDLIAGMDLLQSGGADIKMFTLGGAFRRVP
jgi:hypothetical protein